MESKNPRSTTPILAKSHKLSIRNPTKYLDKRAVEPKKIPLVDQLLDPDQSNKRKSSFSESQTLKTPTSMEEPYLEMKMKDFICIYCFMKSLLNKH